MYVEDPNGNPWSDPMDWDNVEDGAHQPLDTVMASVPQEVINDAAMESRCSDYRTPDDSSSEDIILEGWIKDEASQVSEPHVSARVNTWDQRPGCRPRDDSSDDKNERTEWVRSAVRVKEVDHSAQLREELRASQAAFSDVLRRNEELMTTNQKLLSTQAVQQRSMQELQESISRWLDVEKGKSREALEAERAELKAEMERERAEICQRYEHEQQQHIEMLKAEEANLRMAKEKEIATMAELLEFNRQQSREALQAEKERLRVQKENEIAAIIKQHEHDQRKKTRRPSRPPPPQEDTNNVHQGDPTSSIRSAQQVQNTPPLRDLPQRVSRPPPPREDINNVHHEHPTSSIHWQSPQQAQDIPPPCDHPQRASQRPLTPPPNQIPTSSGARTTPRGHCRPGTRVSKKTTVISEVVDDDDDSVANAEAEFIIGEEEEEGETPGKYVKIMEAMIGRLLDERGFGKQAPTPSPKSHVRGRRQANVALEAEKADRLRSQHLLYVRDLFKDVYGVEQDDDFASFQSATKDEVIDFASGGDGPNQDHPLWDMRGTPTSAWNEVVIEILTDAIIAKIEKEKPFPPKTRSYWENAIREKFARIKGRWSRAQPRTTRRGLTETTSDVEERMVEQTGKRLKRTRMRGRRVNKYERRLSIAQGVAKMKHEAGDSDADTWEWFAEVLERLGADGMSSDESELENDIHMVYRTKVLPWRRNIDTELGIIDSQRVVDADIFSPRGSKPVRRIRGATNLLSARPAVPGLPRIFYDENWLEEQPHKFLAQIPTEKFKWYNILGFSRK